MRSEFEIYEYLKDKCYSFISALNTNRSEDVKEYETSIKTTLYILNDAELNECIKCLNKEKTEFIIKYIREEIGLE